MSNAPKPDAPKPDDTKHASALTHAGSHFAPISLALPSALARQTRLDKLGPSHIPVLLAHPTWDPKSPGQSPVAPAPVCIWLHGRTVSKELDNGRYLRWIRAGIAACAIDLPAHGERFEADRQHSSRTLEIIAQVQHEIDEVLAGLADPRFAGAFDLSRVALGGMSLGGMITLRKLCDPAHPFCCAAVESTAGNLALMYKDRADKSGIAAADAMAHIEAWRPIPLLALHSQADAVVPVACMSTFVDKLREHYQSQHADPNAIAFHTWTATGAPLEHNGFGKVAADAKTLQTDFLVKHLHAIAPV